MKRSMAGAVLMGSLALAGCGGAEDEPEAAASSTPAASSPSPTASASATPTGTGLDQAFGTDGLAKVPMSSDGKDRFSALTLGPDGKVYAAGLSSKGTDQQIAVARFDADGKPDSSFGTDGVASVNVSVNPSTDPAAQLEQSRSVAIQPDGKVVVVGTAEHDATATGDAATDTDAVAVRFDAEGGLDSTWGKDGVTRLDLGTGRVVDGAFLGADQAYGSAARPDGGIVLFANTSGGADRADNDLAMVGLTSKGELDDGFGTEGVTSFDVDKGSESARNIGVVDDDIVATGYSRGPGNVVVPVVVRTSLDGKPDATFGKNGVASHKVLGAVAESYSFGVQGDDYVLTGYGKAAQDDKVDLIAYRFTNKGEFDRTFGDDGITKIDIAGEDDRGRNLAVLPDGRILYVGSGKVDGTDQQAMAVLLSKDGKAEAGFGDNGRLLTDLGGNGDSWYGVALSKDGKTAYLAGFSNASMTDVKSDDSYLARIDLD